MRKEFVLFLVLLLLVNLSACHIDKECEHNYDTEIISEATYSSNGEIKKTCIYCNDEIVETIPQLNSPLKLTVLDISTYEEKQEPLVMPDGMEIFQPSIYWVILDMEVENISEKEINKFSGTLVISSGDQTLNLLCSIEEPMGLGESVRLSDYGFQVEYNDLTMADNMIAGTNFDDLTFDFILSEVK